MEGTNGILGILFWFTTAEITQALRVERLKSTHTNATVGTENDADKSFGCFWVRTYLCVCVFTETTSLRRIRIILRDVCVIYSAF